MQFIASLKQSFMVCAFTESTLKLGGGGPGKADNKQASRQHISYSQYQHESGKCQERAANVNAGARRMLVGWGTTIPLGVGR